MRNNLKFVFSQDETRLYGCSRYTFYAAPQSSVDFNTSRKACKVNGSDLVSIESYEEWNFLKDTITKFPGKETEYYIGLTKDRDGSWRWISNNSKVNESYWAQKTRDTNADCATMYKDYNKYYGLFDDLPCILPRDGYICESKCHASLCVKTEFIGIHQEVLSGQKPCTGIIKTYCILSYIFQGIKILLVVFNNTKENFLWEPEKINVSKFHKITSYT